MVTVTYEKKPLSFIFRKICHDSIVALTRLIICWTVVTVSKPKQVVYFTNHAYFNHPIIVNLKSAK